MIARGMFYLLTGVFDYIYFEDFFFIEEGTGYSNLSLFSGFLVVRDCKYLDWVEEWGLATPTGGRYF